MTGIQTLYQVTQVPSGTYPATESLSQIRTDTTNVYWIASHAAKNPFKAKNLGISTVTVSGSTLSDASSNFIAGSVSAGDTLVIPSDPQGGVHLAGSYTIASVGTTTLTITSTFPTNFSGLLGYNIPNSGIYTGKIYAMTKTGGTATAIVTATDSMNLPAALVVRDGYVYWMGNSGTSSVTINKTPISGGSTTVLTTVASAYGSSRPIPYYLKSDGQYLYWMGTDFITSESSNWNSFQTTIVNAISVNRSPVLTVATWAPTTNSPSYCQTWSVNDNDSDEICYSMLLGVPGAGYIYQPYKGPVNTDYYGTGLRLQIECSSLTKPGKSIGTNVIHSPTFTSAVAGGALFWFNDYGIASELQYTQGNEYLPSVYSAGNILDGDNTSIFYLSSDIHQVNLSDKSDRTISTGGTAVWSMTSDGTSIFWTDGSALYRVSKL